MFASTAVAVTVLLIAVQISPWWFVSRDGCSYLSIARSIAAGETPTNLGRRQLFFAPGYSLLIAPAFWLGERPFLAISTMHAVLAIALLYATWRWLQRHIGRDAALLAAVAVGNASMGILFRRTLSEALFMPALMATSYGLERLRYSTERRWLPLRAGALGCAVAMTCLTRQAGAVLLPGFAIALAVRVLQRHCGWLRAALCLGCVTLPPAAAIMALNWHERHSAGAESRTYVDYLAADESSPLDQVVVGLQRRAAEVGRITIPGMFKAAARSNLNGTVNLAVFMACTAVVAIGWWRAVRASQDVLLCATPFYVGLYVVWPFDEGIRFMTPLAPVWFLGLYWALPDRVEVRRRAVLVAWCLHAVVAVGYWFTNDLPEARADARQWPAIDRLANAVRHDPSAGGWLPLRQDRQRVMLQFALDRPVVDLAPQPERTSQLRWLVAAKSQGSPAGFRDDVSAGEYRLLRRAALENSRD